MDQSTPKPQAPTQPVNMVKFELPAEYRAISQITDYLEAAGCTHVGIKIANLIDQQDAMVITSNCILKKHKKALRKLSKYWQVFGDTVLMLTEIGEEGSGDGSPYYRLSWQKTEDDEVCSPLTVDLDSQRKAISSDDELDTIITNSGLNRLKDLFKVYKRSAISGTMIVILMKKLKENEYIFKVPPSKNEIVLNKKESINLKLQDYLLMYNLVPRTLIIIEDVPVKNRLLMRSLTSTETRHLDDDDDDDDESCSKLTVGKITDWTFRSTLLVYECGKLSELHIRKLRGKAPFRVGLLYKADGVVPSSDDINSALDHLKQMIGTKAAGSKRVSDQFWVQCSNCFKWRKVAKPPEAEENTCSDLSQLIDDTEDKFSCEDVEADLIPDKGFLIPLSATPARGKRRIVRLGTPLDVDSEPSAKKTKSRPVPKPKKSTPSKNQSDDQCEIAKVELIDEESLKLSPKKSPRKLLMETPDRSSSKSPKKSPAKIDKSTTFSLDKSDKAAEDDNDVIAASFDDSSNSSHPVLTQNGGTSNLMTSPISAVTSTQLTPSARPPLNAFKSRDEEYFSLSDDEELSIQHIKQLRHQLSLEKKRHQKLASTVSRFLTNMAKSQTEVLDGSSEQLIALMTDMMEDPAFHSIVTSL